MSVQNCPIKNSPVHNSHMRTLDNILSNTIHLLSIEIILTSKKFELLIFKCFAYIEHQTLSDNSSPGCVRTK